MPRFRYGAVSHYLAAQPTERVTLTLSEIAAIVGRPLPAGAHDAAFWSNEHGSKGPSWAWRSVGWQVTGRVYQHPTWQITFVRDDTASRDNSFG